MPTYIVTGPDGKKYRVSGQGSKEEALAQVQRKVAMPAPAPVQQPAAPVEAPAPEREYGGFLPLSWEKGKKAETWEWDSEGGIPGVIKRALTLPGDVYTGKVPTIGSDGRTSDQLIQRSAEMAGVVTPMNPAMRAGEGVVPGVANTLRKPTSVTPPTAAQLKTAGSEGFNSARAAAEGMRYNPRVTSRMGDFFTNELKGKGFNREGSKQTYTVIDEYFKGGNAPTTYDEFLTVKDALQKVRMDFKNPADKEAAEFILERIYKFVETADPRTVMAGTAPASGTPLIGASSGNTALKSAKEVAKQNAAARANYAAAKRSEFLAGKLDRAERQAAAANSGLNIENTIRQRANDILNSEKLQKGYTPGELALIRKVVEGNVGRETLRYVGNLLGGGGGLGALITGAVTGGAMGSATPSLIGAGVVGAGLGAKVASGKIAKSAMRKVDLTTRMRSPLYQQMLLDAPLEPASQVGNAAMMRALLLSQNTREKN